MTLVSGDMTSGEMTFERLDRKPTKAPFFILIEGAYSNSQSRLHGKTFDIRWPLKRDSEVEISSVSPSSRA